MLPHAPLSEKSFRKILVVPEKLLSIRVPFFIHENTDGFGLINILKFKDCKSIREQNLIRLPLFIPPLSSEAEPADPAIRPLFVPYHIDNFGLHPLSNRPWAAP